LNILLEYMLDCVTELIVLLNIWRESHPDLTEQR
jgi:hypothetical protein